MRRLLRSWLWRVPLEQEVDEEIAFHVEMRTRALIAQGKDPKTARQLAIRHLGDVTRLKRTCVHIGRKRDREMRITQRLEDFGGDVRFAIRQMKGSPGFALVAVLTLALGIGANSAMFALADATVLRPLPYPEPDRLVMVWERSPTAGRTPVGSINLRDVQERNRSFESIATIASNLGGGPLLEAPDGRVESVERQFVSATFFDVLGVTPVAGRTFLSADEGPAPTAVVLSEGLWRTRFGERSHAHRPRNPVERPAPDCRRGRLRSGEVLAPGQRLVALAAASGRLQPTGSTVPGGRRPVEARRDARKRPGRRLGDCRPARAGVSRNQQGLGDHSRTLASRDSWARSCSSPHSFSSASSASSC